MEVTWTCQFRRSHNNAAVTVRHGTPDGVERTRTGRASARSTPRHKATAFRWPENRKVGGSTPPLATTLTCGDARGGLPRSLGCTASLPAARLVGIVLRVPPRVVQCRAAPGTTVTWAPTVRLTVGRWCPRARAPWTPRHGAPARAARAATRRDGRDALPDAFRSPDRRLHVVGDGNFGQQPDPRRPLIGEPAHGTQRARHDARSPRSDQAQRRQRGSDRGGARALAAVSQFRMWVTNPCSSRISKRAP